MWLLFVWLHNVSQKCAFPQNIKNKTLTHTHSEPLCRPDGALTTSCPQSVSDSLIWIQFQILKPACDYETRHQHTVKLLSSLEVSPEVLDPVLQKVSFWGNPAEFFSDSEEKCMCEWVSVCGFLRILLLQKTRIFFLYFLTFIHI